MYRLELCKGLSYHGIVSATKKHPMVTIDDKEKAEFLVSTGYFKQIAEYTEEKASAEAAVATPTTEVPKKALSNYTKAELESYAAEIGADISDCTNNDQRVAVIKEVLAAKEAEQNDGVDGKNEEVLTPAYTEV